MCAVPTVGRGQSRVSDLSVGVPQPVLPHVLCHLHKQVLTHIESLLLAR